jgi:peptidoglycan lytic transglycosylase G
MRKFVSVVFILAAGCVGFFLALLSPVDSSNPYRSALLVLPGESLPEIASTLHRTGVVREPRAFEALVRLRGKARELKAGPYRLASDQWAWQILNRLVSGDFADTSVTITEGLWMAEIGERLDGWVKGGAPAFMKSVQDRALLDELGIGEDSAEGYLFPNTYRFMPQSPAPDIVRQMVLTFRQTWDQGLAARARERGMSMHDVVTLASIVESEARVASERPRIAAVYMNRLSQGVPLQADPTVIYGMGERRSRTLYADLKHPSPYNTYLHPGLPPGPICSPGMDAMKAVLWPASNCSDLYFVARGDGTHLFARDFAGHLKNRRLVHDRSAVNEAGMTTTSLRRRGR